MRTGSIYIIKNTINDKVYIGQTTMSVHERFMTHMKPSAHKRRKTSKLYNAVNKYGRDIFYVETLEENIPIEELDEKEIKYIEKYDSFKNGYNSTTGGDGRIINKIEDEKEVLRLAKNGKTMAEIAKIFNVDKMTIQRLLRHLNFYYRPDQNKIIELAKSGLSNRKIAEIIGCHVHTVSRALNRKNCRKRRVPIRCRDINYDELKADYYNQMTIDDICEKYDISKTTFYRVKKEQNIASRPQIYKSKKQTKQ